MGLTELRHKLQLAQIPPDAYTLYSKPRDETLTIEVVDGIWNVFYYERGIRTDLQTFTSREQAEEYFLGTIIQWFQTRHP